MRSLLVCVRTPTSAQRIAAVAARLGFTTSIRTALSAEEALGRLAERGADVVLADAAVTRPDAVLFTRRVLSRSPQAALVLIGMEDPRMAAAAVAAGARGVIRVGEHEDLVTALAKAIMLIGPGNGRPSVPQQREASPPAVALTERELQVLRGMSEGKSNAEIGRELFVSEDTVKTHARRLFRKLGARDRAHAVASAFRAGLVN